MSVLIKGMDMPQCCGLCKFMSATTTELDMIGVGYRRMCRCEILKIDFFDHTKRQDFCPLVEVPTPHGRLIDADVMKIELSKLDVLLDAETIQRAIESVDSIPTIIESEGIEY